MKISSIIDIVAGDLQNSPAISFITQSHTNISKINDGDLFISSSLKEIQIAISKGAFAIVYDIDIDISTLDKEIAWIKVDNIQKAMIRLLRFNLSILDIQSYSCDEIFYQLCYISKSYKKELVFLDNNLKNNFELLNNVTKETILISTNKDMLYDILPLSKDINIKKHNINNLVVHSLFETSFSYKHRYYYKLKLPMIYVDYFLTLLEFLDIQEYDNQKLNNFNLLKPIFINHHCEIVDFGKSNRFIIANKNISISEIELEFISKVYSYAKIKIVNDDLKDTKLLDIIQIQDYNALYIKHKSYKQIVKLLQDNKHNHKKLF